MLQAEAKTRGFGMEVGVGMGGRGGMPPAVSSHLLNFCNRPINSFVPIVIFTELWFEIIYAQQAT